MAVKKIRIRPEGANDYADILHPETSADQVIASDGVTTFESHLAEIASKEEFGHIKAETDAEGSLILKYTKGVPKISFRPRWVCPGWAGSIQTTAQTNGDLIYTPIFVAKPTTFQAIGVYVDTASAGSTVDIGLYQADENILPSTLLFTGTVDTSTTGLKSVAFTDNIELSPGYYYLASKSNGTPGLSSILTPYTTPITGLPNSGLKDITNLVLKVAAISTPTISDPAIPPTFTDIATKNSVRLLEL